MISEKTATVCSVLTAAGSWRRVAEIDKREIMASNWGHPFGVIRELDRLPWGITEKQAYLFAAGWLLTSGFEHDGDFVFPNMPTDLEHCDITLEENATECTLTIRMTIDDDTWQFVLQCKEN